MNSSVKIFIAGAHGFLGTSLVKNLKELGYSHLLTPSRVDLDLRNKVDVKYFFDEHKPEVVFLCAAKVGGIQSHIKYPADYLTENLEIYQNVIHQAAQCRSKKLIFLGSSCMYPVDAPKPFNENHLFSGSLEKTNHSFAVAKLVGLELCRSLSAQYGLDFVTAIPTGLYGCGDHFEPEKSHVIPALFTKFHRAQKDGASSVSIWGSGRQQREFLYIDDCARALIEIMERDQIDDVINIGQGELVSIKDLAMMIKEITGFNGELKFDQSAPEGMLKKCVDSSKMSDWSWKPKVSLQQGLQKTWNWAQLEVFDR